MGLNCPICYDDVQAQQAVTGLLCGHLFHTDCFDLHRTSGGGSAPMCPQCRSPYTNTMRLYPNVQNDPNVEDLKKKLKEKVELEDNLNSFQEEFSTLIDKLQQVTDMNEHLKRRVVELEGIILSQAEKISKLEEENKVYADMVLKNPVHTMSVQPVQPLASSVRQQPEFCSLDLERTKPLKDLTDSDKSELIKLDAVLNRIVTISGMSKGNLQMTTLEFLRKLANAAKCYFDDNEIEATYRRGWNLPKKELIFLFKTTEAKWRVLKMISSLKNTPNWKFISIKSGHKQEVWELWNYANCLLEHGYTKVYIYSNKVWAYGNRRINILDHAHVDRLRANAEPFNTMNSNTTEVKSATADEKNSGEGHPKGIAPKEFATKRNAAKKNAPKRHAAKRNATKRHAAKRNATKRHAAKEHNERTTTTQRKQSTTATARKESGTATAPEEGTTAAEHIPLPLNLSELQEKFFQYMRSKDI